ncbi:VOC family protein [Testudinibacter sp. P80/BLE/0925]|uniref:VOC family protein n=1 Tax=Testudinibacter sp. TW-1 TaxID=3417757 RepID=UPI003D360646
MTNLTEPHPLFSGESADVTALSDQFAEFERQIEQLAQTIGISLAEFEIDHLAIRVNSVRQGQIWLAALLKCGSILSDNQVNGRPIYLIRLDRPLTFAGQAVSIVELPMPKNKVYPRQGWEHIELVVPFLVKESANEWLNRINQRFGLNENPRLRVKVDEPNVEGEQLCNLSIAVTLQEKTENHSCIKLHPHPIADVVGSERQP